MSATGLDVFAKSLQTTNIWLDELMADIGPDRQLAWHVLGVVLRALRDRVPATLHAQLGAQLPLIIRGAYYDQYAPERDMLKFRNQEEFLAYIQSQFGDIRPVNVRAAVRSVFGILSRHLSPGQSEKLRDALPDELKALWSLDDDRSIEEQAAKGKAAQNAQEARNYQGRPTGQRG